MNAVAEKITVQSAEESESSARLLSFLKKHEESQGQAVEPTYFLSGAGEGDQINLTPQQHELLKKAVEALAQGKVVTMVPSDRLITTQVAAELLGLSRPTVVKLIDGGELPGSVPGGKQRRLRLEDVLDYRDKLKARRIGFIESTSLEVEDDDYDLGETGKFLEEARRLP